MIRRFFFAFALIPTLHAQIPAFPGAEGFGGYAKGGRGGDVYIVTNLNAWGLESHSCGGLWDQNHATAHHTLWAHNHTRNPKSRPAGLLEWINNVTFDWDIGFIMGDSQTPASWKANVIGSYFLAPAGNIRYRALQKATVDRNGNPNFAVHLRTTGTTAMATAC